MDDKDTSENCDNSSLWVLSHSKPYNEKYERIIATDQLYMKDSKKDSEIDLAEDSEKKNEEDTAALKKIRRRRLSRKPWTRRKGEVKSRTLSRSYLNAYAYLNDGIENNNSTKSESSHYNRSHSASSRPPSRRKQKILETVGKPLKTRSVSRMEKEEAEIKTNKFYCEILYCRFDFVEFENLVSHKILDHHIVARYLCEQCNKKYTTQNELDFHREVHDDETFFCCYCRAACDGAKGLQSHLKKHLHFSADCNFCSLSFLDKTDLTKHVAQEHRRERRGRQMKNAFYKYSMKRNSDMAKNKSRHEKKFRIKILEDDRPNSPDDIFATLLQISLSSANFRINRGTFNSEEDTNKNGQFPDESGISYPSYKNPQTEDDIKLAKLKPIVRVERLSEEEMLKLLNRNS